jgi:outer membrane lipoprotein-sorting protein
VGRRPLSRLLLVAPLALLAACATLSRPPINEDARRTVALLTSRASEFTDLRALADIAVKRGSDRLRVQGVLLAKAPASIRFEVLSPFGPPLRVVTVHEGQLTVYDAVKNEAQVGPANAETIEKALRLPLTPEDLVAALAGRVAPPSDLTSAELQPPDEAGPSIDLVSPAGRRRVWLDVETGTVRQVQIYGSPFNALVRYRRDAGGALRGFDVEAAQSYVTGSVNYDNLVEGSGIEAERFTIAIPKGAKIQGIR